MLEAAAKAADDALATDIVGLEVKDFTPFTDNFLIVTVDNPRHMRATIGAIERALKDEKNIAPTAIEGGGEADWTLMDYGPLVVHLFLGEAREFYALEKLWGDAPQTQFEPTRSNRV